MEKIKSLQDLSVIKAKSSAFSKTNVSPDSPVIVKVAMATCGIASGAKDTYEYFIQETQRLNIPAIVSQTGCMSYCYAEPTVEVTLPGQDPVVFGYVNTAKAQEIIDRYIMNHEMVDGIIPPSYKSIE